VKIAPTPIQGCFLLDIEPISDERGFFARTFCRRELEARGMNSDIRQENISFNRSKGTVRGLHVQRAPHGETKIVRCTQGAVFDVIVDLRPSSPSFARWFGTELSSANRRALYVEEGVAHGFQTLEQETEVLYAMGAFYEASAAAGHRYDDPAFAISWPLPVTVISPRDLALPLFDRGAAR
jgi:dTDP-4-dehydrorhamnose 3,5-epimerase